MQTLPFSAGARLCESSSAWALASMVCWKRKWHVLVRYSPVSGLAASAGTCRVCNLPPRFVGLLNAGGLRELNGRRLAAARLRHTYPRALCRTRSRSKALPPQTLKCWPSQPLTVTHCKEHLSVGSACHLSSHKSTETVAVLEGCPLSLCRQILCNTLFKQTETMGQLGKRKQRSLNQILSGLAESEDCSANSCLSHAGVRASPSPTAGNAAQHSRWAGAGFHQLQGQ